MLAAALVGFVLTDLVVPRRPTGAKAGATVADEVASASLRERDERFERELLSGNVPTYLRKFTPVPVATTIEGRPVRGRLFVTPNYLAIGDDSAPFTLNVTPYTAQRIADRLGCVLPTPAMVDAIDAAATVKVAPSPLDPGPAMTTVAYFRRHNDIVSDQLAKTDWARDRTRIVTGTQKDVVICAGLTKAPGKVAIYGWRKLDGAAIQPLYLGHTATWVDYSQAVRLVSNTMEIEGRKMRVEDVLRDPKLAPLISHEGVVLQPRYVFAEFPRDGDAPIAVPSDETLEEFSPEPGVRVVIHAPKVRKPNARLVIYALPNGNSIEQTFGRRMRPGLDWHFDIQHIGAQTRFLRRLNPDESLIVAYLANDRKAWPTWIRGKDAGAATRIIEAVVKRVGAQRVSLCSHSGGGALIYAYVNAVAQIPNVVDRIAFLDSEYNYETDRHDAKLTEWLGKDGHALCLLAYDDANALLDGKPFVSKAGGTWGRTHLMLRDLESHFKFTPHVSQDPERYEALGGRVTIWFKRNPNHEIFHSVQVERNGFIESMLSGTPASGRGYVYFGPRAYGDLIRD